MVVRKEGAVTLIRREINTILAISWFYGFLPLKRNILWTSHYIAAPLSFLFFIYLYGGEARLPLALSGGFVMVTLSTSVSMETEAAFNRIVLKLHDMYVVSPIRPVSYVIGLAIANVLSAIPGLVIFLLLAYLFIKPPIYFTIILLLSLVSIWITFSTVGFLISTLARDVKDLWTWTPIVSVLLSVLPPVFYPAELLPESLRWIVYLIPPATSSRIIQSSLGAVDISYSELASLWSALAIQTGIAMFVLLKSVRWRMR